MAQILTNKKIPNVAVKVTKGDETLDIETSEYFSNKKIALFALPGAFTPTCSAAHLPGFVVQADALKSKGVDEIICMSVNDAFVMKAWSDAQNAEELTMLADGNADFAKSLGLELDGTAWGMGIRSKRFAMIVNNGIVENLEIDESGFEKSSAENILSLL